MNTIPTTTVYKLFRVRKNGTLGPLFIGARQKIPLGEWLPAEDIPTKGFAHRPGWHCGPKPEAQHLTENGRVWAYGWNNRPGLDLVDMREDPTDRRYKVLALTPKGRQLIRQIVGAIRHGSKEEG